MLRKWSNDTFKGKLTQYYTVCASKCILNSFKFLANNLDEDLNVHLFWTKYILMIIFSCTYVVKLTCNKLHTFFKFTCTLIPGIVCACAIYQISFFNFIEILTTDILFMTKGLVLAYSKLRHSATYLEVFVKITRLNMKTGLIDSLFCYISFCFLFTSLRSVSLS